MSAQRVCAREHLRLCTQMIENLLPGLLIYPVFLPFKVGDNILGQKRRIAIYR